MNIQRLTADLQKRLSVADLVWQNILRELDFCRSDAALVLTEGNEALGWLSLWWRNIPNFQGDKTAYIGQYYASTSAVAEKLLEQAQALLREQCVESVLAPIDGDTWHSYRLSDDGVTQPAFFLDLVTPPHWKQDFVQAGFIPVARYCSTAIDLLDYHEDIDIIWQERFIGNGRYQLHVFDVHNTDEQLKAFYRLSIKGFQNNFLYSDISYAEFKKLYEPVLPLIVADLVHMAYADNQLIGFVFCVPDYQQQDRGEKVDTVILKTLVRDPSPQYRGLGAFLVGHSHRVAKEKGYAKVIAAFMHEDNVSCHLCEQLGHKRIRQYALYGKQL